MSEDLNDLDALMDFCARSIQDVRNGEIFDKDQANALFRGIVAYAQLYEKKMKHDPQQIAQEEITRAAARKAAEQIDLSKAKEILINNDFQHLRDAAGIIDIDAKIRDDEKKLAVIRKQAEALSNERPTTDAEPELLQGIFVEDGENSKPPRGNTPKTRKPKH
jgi:transcriptional/translational regulatory protein YebC/TACO1